MKCWKCGQENPIGSMYCINCRTSLERTSVKTPVGKAMRTLYDQYGCQRILTENAYLKNGLGDYLEDSIQSRTIRNQVGTAMDVGLGKVYYEQLKKGGPDNAFIMRVRELLTRSCGFNDYTTNEIMGYFDEMIGWKTAGPSAVPPKKNKRPSAVPPNNNKKTSAVLPQNHKKTQTVPPTKPATQNNLLEKAKSNFRRKENIYNEPLSPIELKRLKAIHWIAVILWCILFTYSESFDKSGFFRSTNSLAIIDIIGFLLIFSVCMLSFPNFPRIFFLSSFCFFIGNVIAGFAVSFLLPLSAFVMLIYCFDKNLSGNVLEMGGIVIVALLGMCLFSYTLELGTRWLNDDRRARKARK